MPSSMLTSMICAPLSTCWRATSSAGLVVAGHDQLAELGRAGDVGALADVDEVRMSGAMVERLEAATGACSGCGLRDGDAARMPSTASAIAAMCSGVVPQQPPTMLTKPAAARTRAAARRSSSGVSSYSPNAFGRPAFG